MMKKPVEFLCCRIMNNVDSVLDTWGIFSNLYLVKGRGILQHLTTSNTYGRNPDGGSIFYLKIKYNKDHIYFHHFNSSENFN